MRFSRLISLPFAITALAILYIVYIKGNEDFVVYLIPICIILAGIFIMGPQIDWLWYKKNPPKVSKKIIDLLHRSSPFFAALDVKEKTRFLHRLSLYMHAHAFQLQGSDQFPIDIKAMIASFPIQMTFGQDEYLLSKFDRIFAYPVPFPSPQFPTRFHSSEIYAEDGVIIFSIRELVKPLQGHRSSFSIGFYEYARIFLFLFPEREVPSISWEEIKSVSSLSQKEIEQTIGLDDVNLAAVFITCFFQFPEKMKTMLPNRFQQFKNVFNLDPLDAGHPVVNTDLITKDF